MPVDSANPIQVRPRDLLFFLCPDLWPGWPLLPVVRRPREGEEDLGVMYDARGVNGTCGYSATVFLANVFELPKTEAEFLQLPKCVYDTAEELAADGWTVD
jgi:hypothetical protein